MESGEIPDDNIVATTNIFGNDQEKYGAQRARLRLLSGYRADLSADKERRFHFIKIKLPKETIITGIATQGFEKEWVTKYTMMASQDNRFVSFRDVDNANPEKVRSEYILNLISILMWFSFFNWTVIVSGLILETGIFYVKFRWL